MTLLLVINCNDNNNMSLQFVAFIVKNKTELLIELLILLCILIKSLSLGLLPSTVPTSLVLERLKIRRVWIQ